MSSNKLTSEMEALVQERERMIEALIEDDLHRTDHTDFLVYVLRAGRSGYENQSTWDLSEDVKERGLAI